MNRFLSLFCAVLMAVASVRAEEPASITPLTNGDNSVVIDNPTSGSEWSSDRASYSHYTLFQYTALAAGHVTIYAVGYKDTYGALFDKDWDFLGKDDSGYGSNFKFERDVKAGEVLYIGARGYSNYEIGSYTIHVDGPLVPCEVGHHTMSHVETPVTCTTDGIKSHYACSTCLHKYSDAEGTEEIDDLTIPALGHHMVGDKCTHEGCGLDVSSNMLQNGDNNVVIDNPTSGKKWNDNRTKSSHYTLFKYTALGNGTVAICLVGYDDTYAALYDKDWNYIKELAFWDDESDVYLTFDVKAGDVYYIGARGYDDEEIGSYTIHVDGPLAPCEVGHHTMSHVETPATCLTTGIKSHYACSTCLYTYSDAEGTEEILDVTIPALGHNIVDDKCTHEGCGLVVSATPLTMGENSVVIDNPTTGEEWENNISNYLHYTLFKHTAQADCNVAIYADGNQDTYGVLFDKDLKRIKTSDEGHNSDFMFEINAKAGDVYYIGARGYDDEEIGSYTIKVEEFEPEAAIGSIKYSSLYAALADVQDGETVTLLADIEYPDGGDTRFETYGTITLDLNGHTMYGYIYNERHLTIEDSSEGKTGKMITLPGYCLLINDDEDNSITINGGTFVGGTITYEYGVYYINGGTFILPDESTIGRTMSNNDNIVFGDGVVYRDLSGEHEDISEVTEDVTYSGTFVKAGTPTAIKDVDASKANNAQKAIKTIENGRVVIIRGGEKFDISGRKM